MDHERLATGPSRPNVSAKPLPLPVQIPLEPVVVEAGLADGHDPGVIGECDQLVDRDFSGIRVIRVDPDGGEQLRVRLG